ncbi:MAG: 23S rRNA (guanosine(2251)-2'-O)-methyltransferase RlmB [Vicinamibacterales bacterium]
MPLDGRRGTILLGSRSSPRASPPVPMLIYGLNPVLEALRAKRVRAIRLADRFDQRTAGIVQLADAQGVPVRRVTREALDRETRHGVHQGVAADVEALAPATLDELTARRDPPPLIVVLDEVEDPQNVGAILRTMDAVGATGLVRQTRRAAPLEGAAAKASAGAVHHVPIADVVNIARAIEALKAAGVWTIGLDAGAELAYHQWDLTLPTALVLGAEGYGLRRLVRERCDGLARIPMRGHVGSLNVSAAAAIVLYEADRQRSRGR